jgi:hypothetical protein
MRLWPEVAFVGVVLFTVLSGRSDLPGATGILWHAPASRRCLRSTSARVPLAARPPVLLSAGCAPSCLQESVGILPLDRGSLLVPPGNNERNHRESRSWTSRHANLPANSGEPTYFGSGSSQRPPAKRPLRICRLCRHRKDMGPGQGRPGSLPLADGR